jgi:lysophospholipase L1-like esterase
MAVQLNRTSDSERLAMLMQTAPIPKSTDAPAPPRRWRRFARIALIDLAILLALAIAAEFTLRAVAPEYGRNLTDKDFTNSCPVALNDDGYRGTALPISKTPGERRILGLGDSVTFGTGVNVEDTWPYQLAARLHESTNKPTAVMNVGLQGLPLHQLRADYQSRWSKYQPDVVGLVVSGNMISLAWVHRHDPAYVAPPYPRHRSRAPESTLERWKTTANRAFYKLSLPSFLTMNAQRGLYQFGVLDTSVNPQAPFGAILAHGPRQGSLDPAEADEAWADFTDDLRDLRDAVNANGATLVVAFAPSRFDLSDSIRDNEKAVATQRFTIDPCARFRSICDQLTIHCVDAKAALLAKRHQIETTNGTRAPLYILGDFTHLNPDGHGAVAQAMSRELRDVTR